MELHGVSELLWGKRELNVIAFIVIMEGCDPFPGRKGDVTNYSDLRGRPRDRRVDSSPNRRAVSFAQDSSP